MRSATARISQSRIRRRSRSNSAQLPGERRNELRKELGLVSPLGRNRVLMDEISEEKVIEEEDE